MGSSWLIVYLVLSGLAVLQVFLLGLQSWEHRRYARSRLRQIPNNRPHGRIMVFAPCKGLDVGLEANLRRLFHQDYSDYELVFILENAWDPACALIRRLMREYPEVPSRLIIAGRAGRSGQKVHNLRVATADLPLEVEYLVFVDSDAQPRPEWLRAIVSRLHGERTGAVTGYRWLVPQHRSLASYLLYSINSRVALLFGNRDWYPVWGGSWAIRRETFEAAGIRDAWQGTLSDDLVAGCVLRKHKLRVEFEPACMVASPLKSNFSQMFLFLRRQYLIGRSYVPVFWAVGFLAVTFPNLIRLATLGAILGGLLTGTLSPWIPIAVYSLLYGLNVYRGMIRQDLAGIYFPHLESQLRGPRRFDIWMEPLISLVNWVGMISSLFGQTITWRGVTYRLFRGGRIETTHRCEEPTSPDHEPPREDSDREIAPKKRHASYRRAG